MNPTVLIPFLVLLCSVDISAANVKTSEQFDLLSPENQETLQSIMQNIELIEARLKESKECIGDDYSKIDKVTKNRLERLRDMSYRLNQDLKKVVARIETERQEHDDRK